MKQSDIAFEIKAPTEEPKADLSADEAEVGIDTVNVEDVQTAAEADALSAEETERQNLRENLRRYLGEEDTMFSKEMIRELLGGAGLVGLLRHNWKLLILIIFFSMVYVSLGYFTREKMIENDTLSKNLLDSRYKSLTLSSELRERTLGSKVESQLKDTTLRQPTERPFCLPVEKEKAE